MSGLIVSIQNFNQRLTDELSDISIKSGAAGIRTDKPINTESLIIGLKKNHNTYYISTDFKDLEILVKQFKNIAIDSRQGNDKIIDLYNFVNDHNCNICADIENENDLINLFELERNKKIKAPKFISTTFSFMKTDFPDIHLVKQIKKYFLKSFSMAEGGYYDYYNLLKGYSVDYVCIGAGIFDIDKKISKISKELK